MGRMRGVGIVVRMIISALLLTVGTSVTRSGLLAQSPDALFHALERSCTNSASNLCRTAQQTVVLKEDSKL